VCPDGGGQQRKQRCRRQDQANAPTPRVHSQGVPSRWARPAWVERATRR
jgi:hypothetical protein